jgi:hypothetical protein
VGLPPLTFTLTDCLSTPADARGCLCLSLSQVQSVLSETDVESLDLAMSMMGPQELAAVEDEVKVIQSNVRTWLLRKNYTNLRDAAKTLQVAWRGRRSLSGARRGKASSSSSSSGGVSAGTSGAARKTLYGVAKASSGADGGDGSGSSSSSGKHIMSLHRSNNAKSMDACAATLQAATRGMLARRSFQRAKKQTMASLVIFQWWVQSKSKSGGCFRFSVQPDHMSAEVQMQMEVE